jgi:glycosyltransferase involved in cell wall biosynthesis
MFGKRCVATVHGLDWQREKWGHGFASKYIKFGERIMVKYADEIIVLSESARQYFMDTYQRKTVLIHNGIDRPKKKEADLVTKKFGLNKDEYICMVSRLTAEKGVHYLIEAFNQIKTDKKLVIAGDTSDTDEYVTMIKKMADKNPNIIFTGFVSGDLLSEIYSNAYFVVLPSDIEGMSLSLLEAFAYGNAVLCSDIPENTLVTEDRAILFKKSNVFDLTDKLQELCNDPSKIRMLKNGADDFILSKYSWSDVSMKTLNLYQEVLKSNKKGAGV